jgi:hypothetical protein
MSSQRLTLDPRLLASPVGAVLVRATSKNLEERYPSAAAMLADLERVVVEPGYALPPPTKTRPMQAIEHAEANALSAKPASAPLRTALAGAPVSSATVVMEDPDEGVIRSGNGARSTDAASPSVRAMRHLGADVSAAPTPRSLQISQNDRLVSTAADQPQPSGIWSSGSGSRPRPVELPGPAITEPLPAGPPVAAPFLPPAPSTRAKPQPTRDGLRIAVWVVFALVALGVGVGVWLLICAA